MQSERYKLSLPILLQRFTLFVFISPHLDDAVLSCGQLLEEVHKHHKKSQVITVFTRASESPYIRFAKNFVSLSGYRDAHTLFLDRKKEDVKAIHMIGSTYMHFNYIDAAWRIKEYDHTIGFARYMKYFPSITHVYGSPKSIFSGTPSAQDNTVIRHITEKLKKYLMGEKYNDILLLSPLGIGGHVDHVIIRTISISLGYPVLFWEDFPYNANLDSRTVFFSKNKNYTYLFSIHSENTSLKYNAIRSYKSQVPVLFPNGTIPVLKENYYSTRGQVKK